MMSGIHDAAFSPVLVEHVPAGPAEAVKAQVQGRPYEAPRVADGM
jgi:hypothetical protein